LAKEVDDIFTLITCLDECKMFSSLPKYVSDDPDGMPSSRLYEGDLHSLMAHLSKLDQKVAIFDGKLDVVVQHLHMYTSNWPALEAGPGPSNRSAETSTPRAGTSRDRYDKQQVSTVDWATAVERGVRDDDDDESWQTVRSSSKRRRRSRSDRQQHAASAQSSSVSIIASTVASTAVSQSSRQNLDRRPSTSRSSTGGGGDGRSINNQQQPRRQQQQPQQQQRSAKRNSVTVIGRRNATQGEITAAKPYVAKSVYCVDNILKDVSESDEIFSESERYISHNLSCC